MSTRFAVMLAVLAVAVVVLGGFVVASGASGPGPSITEDANAANSNETAMGAQISSFMGASAAEANGSVENGMFSASFNASGETNRTAVVERRTGVLERRLERLRSQKAALIADRENMTRAAYVARMSALSGRIEALQESVNQTATFAAGVDANVSRLDRLGTKARNLTGPEIAELARNGTVGVGNPGRGPPNGTPGNGKGKGNDGNQGNGTDGNRGNGNDGDQGEGNDDDDGDQGSGGGSP